mgnify:CR=1 FL=1|tara:strand:- start:3301 stop:3504 length:204 start_codon:yes stop_codon:yes gene_type:complete
MGYWADKCFMCYFIGALIAIVSLSTHTVVKQKKQQRKKELVLDTTINKKEFVKASFNTTLSNNTYIQ